ncbi:hypothetical protein [Streptomyces sp. cmx-4-25]|uniref:hypothetical protein n=1 Tax=Streptomyces sp. cmx-4-25 TaxID=2790933 RepID=UPI00397FB7AC
MSTPAASSSSSSHASASASASSSASVPATSGPVVSPEKAVRDAALWIEALLKQFPELLTELAPGRPSASAAGERRAPSPGDAERIREERRDSLLAQQRHGTPVPGYSAAPLRLHVSDAVRDITDGVVELDEAVHDKLGLGRPRHARVPQRLVRIAGFLPRVATHPELAAHVRDEARRMARRSARVLGDSETMVRVNGRCPWCDSVSLRAFPARRAVLCVNPACRCAGGECDCRTDPAYRHVWHEGDWEALADAAGTDRAEIDVSMDESADDRTASARSTEGARR